MPRNKKKEYSFVPEFSIGHDRPHIPTYESYRARIEAGGTFFRSKGVGAKGNEIAIEIVGSGTSVVLKVYGPLYYEEVIHVNKGDGYLNSVEVFNGAVTESITIIAKSPKEFSVFGSASGNIGIAKVGQVFRNNKLIFIIVSGEAEFVIGDKFTLNTFNQYEEYSSNMNSNPNPIPVATTDPITGITTTPEQATEPSPAFADIRAQVNANSKIIDMCERGWDYVDDQGTDQRSGRSVRPYDPSMPAKDATFMSYIPKTFLLGGSGFPSDPNSIKTGPDRTFIHINRGEDIQGVLKEINKVFEWSGTSSKHGSFTEY